MPNQKELHQRYQIQAAWTKPMRQHCLSQCLTTAPLRILEVGCGTGVILSELQIQYPTAQCVGIDVDSEALHTAFQSKLLSGYAQSDAVSLPFPSASFDLIYCHFFLLWASPLDVILQEIKRVLQPGAPFIVFAEPDYGGRIDFPSDLQLLGDWQEGALRKRGAHTRVGRQLGELLQQAGLTSIETGLIGGQWKIPQEANRFNNEWHTLEADLLPLESFDPVKFKQLKALATRYEQVGTRILFVPTFYAFGFKPAEKNK